jgi:hypothetical protein
MKGSDFVVGQDYARSPARDLSYQVDRVRVVDVLGTGGIIVQLVDERTGEAGPRRHPISPERYRQFRMPWGDYEKLRAERKVAANAAHAARDVEKRRRLGISERLTALGLTHAERVLWADSMREAGDLLGHVRAGADFTLTLEEIERLLALAERASGLRVQLDAAPNTTHAVLGPLARVAGDAAGGE